jgi:hypothetical protein
MAAIGVRWPFMFSRASPQLAPDTIGYFAIADRMGEGQVFFANSTYRGPGYATFILLTDLLPGSREANLTFGQHVLGIALVVGILVWAWRALGPVTATLASISLAVSPLLFIIEDEALPDFLLGALVTVFAILLARVALQSPGARRWLPLAAGVVLGCATLTKPVAQAALLAPPLTLAFARWPRRDILRTSLVVLAGFAVPVLPFVVHSAIRFGETSLTRESGVTLFVREFEIGGRPIPADTRNGKIVADAVAAAAAQGLNQRSYITGLDALRKAGLSDREAQQAERGIALHDIRKQPFGYTWKTIQLSDRFLYEARGTKQLAEPLLPRAGDNATGLTEWLWSVGEWFSNRWWMFSIHGFAFLLALLIGPQRRRVICAALASVGALIALATAATHGGLPRYSWSLLPLTYVVGWAGAVSGAIALWRGARDTPAY